MAASNDPGGGRAGPSRCVRPSGRQVREPPPTGTGGGGGEPDGLARQAIGDRLRFLEKDAEAGGD